MRWGIAGHGDVVSRRVLPALRAAGQEPVFLWGRDAGRAAAAARRWGVAESGSDPRGLLAGLDAVYVATPVDRHVPLAALALDAGLPVLVEKPLAGSLRPGGSALATGRACAGVAYYRRLAPVVRELRRALRGWSPERVEVRFRSAFEPGPGHPMRWRTERAVAGGGVLADAGSHRLDLLLMLFGRPAGIRARLGRRFPGGAERAATVELEWDTGLRAHCSAEWGDGPPEDLLALHSGGRSLTLDPLDSGELLVREPDGVRRVRCPPDANPHLPLVADFVAAVAAGRPPVCPVAEAVEVDDVLVAAERSDALGGAQVRPWPP
ncbi:Gfo/Idh/MocA family oxidoreductase [Streptomyces sp. C11-1]|uniref:Gfo/Idh/MocA family oxidoreductase n=1 Tax=Streptomyces durocortorensis TaxID=2811104 RepID=A0ABY9VW32_9ACTN|nr:Gfo/Idh/MocA family oxidoreductase [Streptomyces durocortorensis]WNF28119.1 Gfo/Idh/MocA family oxidoreductase [Streptomyces durocortorensis]